MRSDATVANQVAWDRAGCPKSCNLVESRALASIAAKRLRLERSPEQIAGRLKRTYPDDEHYQLSHETIYRSLFVLARGALR